MARQMNPDERRRYEAQKAEWARTRMEFEAMYERLKERWREEDERRERRAQMIRKLLPFRRAG
jgi:hypothetical protein